MSVLFKNMEIPVDCRDCPFNMFYNNCGETRCRANNEILAVDYMAIPFSGRPDWCPIIELPPHGRLIDADALKELYDLGEELDYCHVKLPVIRLNIDDMPTILEAEVEE